MADRTLGQTATLYADLPGGDADTITVTVTDPYGATVASAAVTSSGDNRYFYTTPILLLSGVYDVVWSYAISGLTVRQTITVGRQSLSGITKYDLRIQIASRVGNVEYGQISAADLTTISDTSLLGGADEFLDWWIMLGPNTLDAGRAKRVVGYNGSAIELSDSFLTIPARGSIYTLFELNPRETDRALAVAINELSLQTRIETRFEAIAIANDLLVVPKGITHVSEIYANGTKLTPDAWHMRSGRRIFFDTTPDAPLDLIGLRQAGFPQFEDSIVETDPAATIARAANLLHANRAGGAAIDTEEHLRRQLAAADDFERARRTAVGRILPGTRIVVD